MAKLEDMARANPIYLSNAKSVTILPCEGAQRQSQN